MDGFRVPHLAVLQSASSGGQNRQEAQLGSDAEEGDCYVQSFVQQLVFAGLFQEKCLEAAALVCEFIERERCQVHDVADVKSLYPVFVLSGLDAKGGPLADFKSAFVLERVKLVEGLERYFEFFLFCDAVSEVVCALLGAHF